MQVDLITHTSGAGFLSTHLATVKIQFLEVIIVSDEDSDDRFGEFRAYFDTKDWDCNIHGLIYSDQNWLDSLRSSLVAVVGFSQAAVADDILYFSEQGMQTETYVSMDVEEQFIKEWQHLMLAEST